MSGGRGGGRALAGPRPSAPDMLKEIVAFLLSDILLVRMDWNEMGLFEERRYERTDGDESLDVVRRREKAEA
jgi:hypothetical protein